MTATITTWPAHTTTPAPVPLPHLALCGECDEEIRIRTDGRLYAHGCPEDDRLPVIALKATFARWLWTQSKRRDDFTNRLTLFAGRIFRPCTRTVTSPRDVAWSTAEELHGQLHLLRLARSGSTECDALCKALAEAGRHYDQLLAAYVPRPTAQRKPVVHVRHDPRGWVLPDYTDLHPCTSNHHRAQDGREPCTAIAVWRVVEDHDGETSLVLSLSFWCDADLPDEYRPQEGAAA
jgi:hypothetical protein